MKAKTIYLFSAIAIVFATLLSSCGKSNEPSPLVAQSERLALDFNQLADESPNFVSSIDVDYADATLGIDIAFADSAVTAADCSEALVQFAVAQYLKGHTGANLDEIINTLTKEDGKLAVKIVDVKGDSAVYNIGHTRLKQLLKLRPMEIGYSEAKTSLEAILANSCEAYAAQYKAETCEFEVKGGFAQYTLTFAKPSAFASLTQPTLTGRYLKVLQAKYDDLGACRPFVEDLVKSLDIDGYRFVYTDKAETKTLSAALPWRLIDKQ